MSQSLPHAPAAERNRVPLLSALKRFLVAGDRVLELGSGTGQHATFFAKHVPELTWLPTDRAEVLPGLEARVAHEAVKGVAPPEVLDVTQGPWPAGPFDVVFTANTCHIMAWEDVAAMFSGVGEVLRRGGLFLVYGPFFERGKTPAEGNLRFDTALRCRNPRQGLREVEALESLACRHHLVLTTRVPMPANNQLLVWTRDD